MENERIYGGEFLISEANRTRSRKQVTIAVSQTLKAGAVLACLLLGNATVGAAAASGTNTGNGAFGTATADAGAPAGDYRVLFIEPASNLGSFAVYKPDGSLDTPGHGVVGTAYNGTINFTIADGATDFVSGDEFKVNVSYAAGAGTWGAVDPTAVTGMQTAAGILWDAVTTDGSNTAQATVIVCDAEVDGALLDFGTLDSGQKATAKAQLAALGIVIR